MSTPETGGDNNAPILTDTVTATSDDAAAQTGGVEESKQAGGEDMKVVEGDVAGENTSNNEAVAEQAEYANLGEEDGGFGLEEAGNDGEEKKDEEPVDYSAGLWPEYCNPGYRMPEEIEVKVKLASGDYFFPVSIEKTKSKKVYLGGYRNKMTGKIYHHSSSQTPTIIKKEVKDVSKLRCRETQTYEERTVSVQPYREAGTQMARQDLLIDNVNDYELSAKEYFTSEQLLQKKRENSVFIQRCWRGYMARCVAFEKRRSNAEYEQKLKDDATNALLAEKARQDADMYRRQHPKTNEDFSILYTELDTWRKEQMAKVKANTKAGPERVEAMNNLLLEETKVLGNIHKLKVIARKSTHVEKTEQMLNAMSKPHQWQLSSGEVAKVSTPATQRAKELLDLYNALQSPIDVVDERLDVLLHVKWSVLEFDSALTKDIADLTDREADLLNRGRSLKSMERLRKRLANLFLEFINEPNYNPRAADFLKNPLK